MAEFTGFSGFIPHFQRVFKPAAVSRRPVGRVCVVSGMTISGQPVERLRQYLRELKPSSRTMLVTELERGLLRGDGMPGAEFVLQELRRSIREASRPSARVGNLA